VGSAKGILFLADLIPEINGCTLIFLAAFFVCVVGDAMQARPNMASSSDINQDFDSAPRRLETPEKRQDLVY